jgi:cytochrome c oxidase subunit 4
MTTHAENKNAVRTYSIVLGALLTLTAVTVTAAGINFGSAFINVVIALAIASAKASLVALYFMHLRHDRPMSAIIFVTGLAMLAIFLMFCFLDTLSREQAQPGLSAQAPARAVSISARILSAS